MPRKLTDNSKQSDPLELMSASKLAKKDLKSRKKISYNEFNASLNDASSTTIYHKGKCKAGKKSKQFAIPIDAVGAKTLYVQLAICG